MSFTPARCGELAKSIRVDQTRELIFAPDSMMLIRANIISESEGIVCSVFGFPISKIPWTCIAIDYTAILNHLKQYLEFDLCDFHVQIFRRDMQKPVNPNLDRAEFPMSDQRKVLILKEKDKTRVKLEIQFQTKDNSKIVQILERIDQGLFNLVDFAKRHVGKAATMEKVKNEIRFSKKKGLNYNEYLFFYQRQDYENEFSEDSENSLEDKRENEVFHKMWEELDEDLEFTNLYTKPIEDGDMTRFVVNTAVYNAAVIRRLKVDPAAATCVFADLAGATCVSVDPAAATCVSADPAAASTTTTTTSVVGGGGGVGHRLPQFYIQMTEIKWLQEPDLRDHAQESDLLDLPQEQDLLDAAIIIEKVWRGRLIRLQLTFRQTVYCRPLNP